MQGEKWERKQIIKKWEKFGERISEKGKESLKIWVRKQKKFKFSKSERQKWKVKRDGKEKKYSKKNKQISHLGGFNLGRVF